MISKTELGIGYLIGTGLALVGVLFLRLLIVPNSVDPRIWMGTITGCVLSLCLVYAGSWLQRSDLTTEQIWTVAKWAAVGLAALTVLSTPAVLRIKSGVFLEQSILINNLAAGGVAGTLFGLVIVLKREREEIKEINQHKSVLNRILRHNIRNTMNIIIGFAIDIEQESTGDPEVWAQGIERQARDVVKLSDAARRIETLAETDDSKTINVNRLIEMIVDDLKEGHPYVQFDLELEPNLFVKADDLIEVGIENVIESTIKYNKHSQPSVSISGAKHPKNRTVEIRVADNGPGIPELIRTVISEGEETKLNHLDGVGLWVAKWIVDSYGGEISFHDSDPYGTTVRIELPMAQTRINQLKRSVVSGKKID